MIYAATNLFHTQITETGRRNIRVGDEEATECIRSQNIVKEGFNATCQEERDSNTSKNEFATALTIGNTTQKSTSTNDNHLDNSLLSIFNSHVVHDTVPNYEQLRTINSDETRTNIGIEEAYTQSKLRPWTKDNNSSGNNQRNLLCEFKSTCPYGINHVTYSPGSSNLNKKSTSQQMNSAETFVLKPISDEDEPSPSKKHNTEFLNQFQTRSDIVNAQAEYHHENVSTTFDGYKYFNTIAPSTCLIDPQTERAQERYTLPYDTGHHKNVRQIIVINITFNSVLIAD
ncbi:uncharacterized protein C8R40DRAFT_1172750 [Lentinula edodes]|uniref:uncharacterized protein n=1 Tax=Lentinula edodes TaxID=5353 RepID=UPI001E8E483A|nr:uncharacterized protein C8R40DRAFT_1172750 [Lentinula edodes]KAH7873107.1 hypothetical protein C8R40DRAFT_1172750 [Lentinula edodes]